MPEETIFKLHTSCACEAGVFSRAKDLHARRKRDNGACSTALHPCSAIILSSSALYQARCHGRRLGTTPNVICLCDCLCDNTATMGMSNLHETDWLTQP